MSPTALKQIEAIVGEVERVAYEAGFAAGLFEASTGSQSAESGPRVYTVSEAGALLGIGKNTAYAAVKHGTFPTPVVRIGRKWLVLRAPLDRILYGNGKT
jgi:excisionase family DNA binding protein